MEREVRFPVRVRGPVNTIEVEALLDSGATGCFIDKSWALDRRLRLSKLVKPVPVLNVDGTRNQEGDITHYISGLLIPSKPPWSSLSPRRMERSAWFRTIDI